METNYCWMFHHQREMLTHICARTKWAPYQLWVGNSTYRGDQLPIHNAIYRGSTTPFITTRGPLCTRVIRKNIIIQTITKWTLNHVSGNLKENHWYISSWWLNPIHLKNMFVKLDHLPRDPGWKLKKQAWNQHPDFCCDDSTAFHPSVFFQLPGWADLLPEINSVSFHQKKQ